MNFIKKNKFTIIAILLFIGLVLVGVKVKNLLVPDEGKAAYGDRLNEIEGKKVSDTIFKTINDKLKENEKVLEVSHQLHGKIINILITVSDDLSVNDGKKIANSVVSMFEDDELSLYTLQVYVLKEDEKLNNFPIIGYKDPETDTLIFTKDRDIVSEDDNNEE